MGIGSVSVPGLKPFAIPGRRAAARPVRDASRCGRRPARAAAPAGTVAAARRRPAAAAPLPAARRRRRADGRRRAGDQLAARAPFSVDLLRLSSPAPIAGRAARSGGRVVTDPGNIGQSSVTGVRVALQRALLAGARARALTPAGGRPATAARSAPAAGARRLRQRVAGPGRLQAGVVPVRAPERRGQELRRLRQSPSR